MFDRVLVQPSVQWLNRKQFTLGPQVICHNRCAFDRDDAGVVQFEIQLSALLTWPILRTGVRADVVAVLALLAAPFFWSLGSIWFQRKLEPRYAEVRNQAGFLNGQLTNNLLGISTIKSFVAEEREIDRVDGLSRDYVASNRRAIRLSSAFSPLIRIVILCGFTGTLVLGAKMVFANQMQAATYATMVFLTQRLLWPLTGLAETMDQYERAMASTRRILDLLATPIAVRRAAGGRGNGSPATRRGSARRPAVPRCLS